MKLEYVGGPLDGEFEILTEKRFKLYKETNWIIEKGHRYHFMNADEQTIKMIYRMPVLKS